MAGKTPLSFVGPIARIVYEMQQVTGLSQGQQRYLDAAIDLLSQAKGALAKTPMKSSIAKSIVASKTAMTTISKLIQPINAAIRVSNDMRANERNAVVKNLLDGVAEDLTSAQLKIMRLKNIEENRRRKLGNSMDNEDF